MEKIKKMYMKIMAACLLLLGLVTTTVSAATYGEAYPFFGFNLGYALIVLAIVLIGIGYAIKNAEIIKKPLYGIGVVMIMFGLFFAGIPIPAVTETADVTASVDWDVDASALTTAGTYYPDTTFEDYASGGGQFVVPYGANTSSNALYEDGDNSSYSDDPVLQFVCEPDAPEGSLTTEMFTIYFEIINPDLYCGSDADNRVITETSDIVQATWTDDDGNTDMVSGWVKTTANDPVTINLTLNLYEAGLSEATLFEPNTLQFRIYNAAGTWSESFTVSFMMTTSWTTGK